MNPISVADFIDHWKGSMVYGKSTGSGDKLALNPDCLSLAA